MDYSSSVKKEALPPSQKAEPVRPSSFFSGAVASVAVASVLFAGAPARFAAVAATPPPTPPPIGTPVYPSPPPNARKGLEGVWEVQIQHPTVTDYTHFRLTQQGNTLTGTYLDTKGRRYPLAGSVDGQAVRLIVTMPNGTTLLLEGKLDGTTDMVGMLTMPDGQLPFTASYRAKEKWIENVNPSPGGISQPGSYTPP